jgi:hypothetical protein
MVAVNGRKAPKMKTLRALLRQFWLPAVVAVAWVFLNRLSGASAISAFSAAFFLASWATGQVWRVRKESRVDESLTGITGRLQHVATELERSTQSLQRQSEQIFGHAVGSRELRVDLVWDGHEKFRLCFSTPSEFPVFDVQGNFVDLSRYPDVEWMKRTSIDVGTVHPRAAHPRGPYFTIPPDGSMRLNIFLSCRRGLLTVEARFIRQGERLYCASRCSNLDGELCCDVPSDFPAVGDPEDVFAVR